MEPLQLPSIFLLSLFDTGTNTIPSMIAKLQINIES